jgi:hypothetical protein
MKSGVPFSQEILMMYNSACLRAADNSTHEDAQEKELRPLFLARLDFIDADIVRAFADAKTYRDFAISENRLRDAVQKIAAAQCRNTSSLSLYAARLPCPLCGGVATDGDGFTLPLGLDRHLRGASRAQRCVVIDALNHETKKIRQRLALCAAEKNSG